MRLEAPDEVRPLLEEHVRLLRRRRSNCRGAADRSAMTRRRASRGGGPARHRGLFSPRCVSTAATRALGLEVEPGRAPRSRRSSYRSSRARSPTSGRGRQRNTSTCCAGLEPAGRRALPPVGWDGEAGAARHHQQPPLRRGASVTSRAEIDPRPRGPLRVRIDSGPSFYLASSTCRAWSTCPTDLVERATASSSPAPLRPRGAARLSDRAAEHAALRLGDGGHRARPGAGGRGAGAVR